MRKTSREHQGELPKTWPTDQATGVASSNNERGESKRAKDVKDEGIRPDDLNSENDQGAS